MKASTCSPVSDFSLKFHKERRRAGGPAAAAMPSAGGASQAQAISQFYADLVQTSGVRWAEGGTAAAAQPGEGAAAAAPAGAVAMAGADPLQQAMDRATVTPAGVVILHPPLREGELPDPDAAASSGAANAEATAAAVGGPEPGGGPAAELSQAPHPPRYGISKRNVGYQLLQKAGWREGAGLGAQEQGRREPLAPAAVLGQTGLGFQSRQRHREQPLQQQQQQRGAQAHAGQQGAGGLQAQPQQAQQVQLPKRPLPPDPLEKESLDVKVKRVKQVLQTEADDRAGKAIQRYIYSAFNDATGEPTADSNPLLRPGRSKLSATNPLL